MAKKIPLRGRYGAGMFAIVDDRDYDRLSRFRWHGRLKSTGKLYAQRSIYMGLDPRSGRKRSPSCRVMHFDIIERRPGLLVDHKNGNSLDNRRRNLRYATMAQNAWNANHKPGESGLIGVAYLPNQSGAKKFNASIGFRRQRIFIGCFMTAEQAARARDMVALKLRGRFAVLNFPRKATR